MNADVKPRGWGWPLNAQKAHYFIDGRSLCGKWAFFGRSLEDNNDGSSDNCRDCKRRVAKMRPTAVTPSS